MSGGRAPTWSGASGVATDGGHDLIAAKALHNLGYCDLLAGDIPAALQLFNVAADALPAERARLSAGAGDRQGRALLAAGPRR